MSECEKAAINHFEYDDLLEFYEKHYFFEADMREKLLTRTQVSFAMIASLGSFLFYMLSNIKSFPFPSFETISFIFFMTLSICFLAGAIHYFIKTFFGYTYEFVPTSLKTEEYHQQLITTYAEFDNCDELTRKYFIEYLSNAYIQCESVNTIHNAKRSSNFHNTVKFLIPAFLLAFFAIFFFYLGHLNKEQSSEMKVRIINPLDLKGEIPKKMEVKITNPAEFKGEVSLKTTSREVKGKSINPVEIKGGIPQEMNVKITNMIEVKGGMPYVKEQGTGPCKDATPTPTASTPKADQGGL